MKKALSLMLTFAFILTMLPTTAQAYSQAYGSEVWLRDTALQDNVVLSDNIYWSDYYSQLRHEYYFTYTPGGTAAPAAVYGTAVCDRLTTAAAAQSYEAMGYRVVGAINGDYYDTATGFPLGIVVSGGELMAASGENYAVGFRADGTAKIGKPVLTMTAASDTDSCNLASINKPRAENGGVTLLTYDFRSDHTTGTTTQGVNVICTVLDGVAAIGGELLLEVTEIIEGDQPVILGEDQVALTAAATAVARAQEFIGSLQEGGRVKVTVTAEDAGWNEVTEAIGAYYLLVENGEVQTGLPTGYAPRTAIGVKENGDVVFYTVDGRQTGYSMGASFKVLSERMVELGCVTAVCLDGGGSTTAVASMPDSETAQVVNSPSDGSQRKVSNHILLLAELDPYALADHVYLDIDAPVVLAGKSVAVKATLVDENYAPLSEVADLTASTGEIVDGCFVAPAEAGVVTITASAAGMTASKDILVIDTPDELTVQWDGKDVTEMTLFPGDTAELTASVIYNHLSLETSAQDFTWTIDPALGTLENGILTTGFTEGSGDITVSMGSKSVTVSLTLDADSPFVDTVGHWGSTFMSKLYHKGILSGVEKDGLLYANPDTGVSRAEFAVLLCRYLGLNAADYASVEVPFVDMDTVGSWAANEVRAMYALGIINGVANADGTQSFAPQSQLSRAQAVTMLGRADLVAEEPADLSQFSDADKIPEYAVRHFHTMVAAGVIGGSYGKLDPNGTMTRASVCKVLSLMP